MTTLTTRKEIVTTKRIIGSELAKMQQAFYDEEILQFYKEDDEEHLYWEMYDCFHNEYMDYPSFNKVIGLNHADIGTFTNKLSKRLTLLFQSIKATEFVIISYSKLDFFGNRNHDFKPLQEAYKKLEAIVGDKTFKEAFTTDIDSLPDFIEIFFWITRCDSSAPEFIFIFDKDEKIQISLCKYGNIHLTEHGKEELTADKLEALGWTIIEGPEFDNFSDEGRIEGRQIEV